MENSVTPSEYTAGPWHIGSRSGLTCNIKDIAGRVVAASAGDNFEANAHLIAAAPELLDAAQFAYGVLCSLSNLRAVRKSSDYAELNEACDMLAVAANKARGE